MDPGSHGQLGDENVATLGKQDGRLGRDHLDFRVSLHDLLDARQRQLVELVVVLVGFEVVDCVLPIRGQDVLVLAMEALVDIGPCACVKFRWREARIGKLLLPIVSTMPGLLLR